jgi:hypothetical protein
MALIATVPHEKALAVDGISGVRLGKRGCRQQWQKYQENLHG